MKLLRLSTITTICFLWCNCQSMTDVLFSKLLTKVGTLLKKYILPLLQTYYVTDLKVFNKSDYFLLQTRLSLNFLNKISNKIKPGAAIAMVIRVFQSF